MIRFKQMTMAVFLVAGFAMGIKAQAQVLYNITDLGSLGGVESRGFGINASGQVTGESAAADGSTHAFVTNSNGLMIDLGTLGGRSSSGRGINDSGQVAGSAELANGRTHAFVTDNSGVMIDLGTLGVGGFNSHGLAINSSGQVTGNADIGGSGVHAFITSNGSAMIDLGTLDWWGSYGTGINDSGQVTGWIMTDVGQDFFIINSSSGQKITLESIFTTQGVVSRAINASGYVVGSAYNTLDGNGYAFVTDSSGAMINLGNLGGTYGEAAAINASGQVVGYSYTADERPHAFVTVNGTMTDLNTLLASSTTGWEIVSATGINAKGQITGYGIHHGIIHAFILTPTDLPVPVTPKPVTPLPVIHPPVTAIPETQGEVFYKITDLGTLGGSQSRGFDINTSGQITGYANRLDGSTHAFVTDSNGLMNDLGTLGGYFSYGNAINISGQVTGKADTTDGIGHAFVTDNSGAMIDLGTLGGEVSAGYDINASGQVTGNAFTTDGYEHAFVTDSSGLMKDLGTLGGYSSAGKSINNAGQVTGYSETADGSTHAFVTDNNGAMVDLDTVDGLFSRGLAINAAGQVTGYMATADGGYHAFVTNSSGAMTDLGSLDANSYGNAINAVGQVVGYYGSALTGIRAFVFVNGVMKDLNTLLIPGSTDWVLDTARGINDFGQITGQGKLKGVTHAFLLTPVYDPVNTTSVPASRANRDSVKLTESQKDEIKCGPVHSDPVSHLKSKECHQNTTGTYTVTSKLSAATVAANGISIADLNAETQLNINIGTFAFSGSLATADPNKSKLPPTALPGIWTQQHLVCLKPNPDAGCAKSKQVIDGTVKMSMDNKKSLIVTLSGKKSVVEGNDMGQQIYSDACKANAAGKSTLNANASISIGGKIIPMPLKISCSVQKTSKKPVYSTTGPFELINMAIKAELALIQ